MLPGRPAFYFQMLLNWTARGGVCLIIVDDAHDLGRAPRKWLLEFVDTLADGDVPEIGPVSVGVVLLGNGLPDGSAKTKLFARDRHKIDFEWIQFERRLATTDHPVTFIAGLDEGESGAVLARLQEIYRPQFPELELDTWCESLFHELMADEIDFASVKRARMDSIVKCVVMALDAEARAGGWGAGIGPRLETAGYDNLNWPHFRGL